MAIKADLMAAIERVNLAVQGVAKMVSALPDDGVQQPSTEPVSVRVDATAKQFAVKAMAGIDTVKWVLVNGQSGRWYGPITSLAVTREFGEPVAPPYAAAGDFVAVMWGGTQGMDKSIKAPAYAPVVVGNPPTPTQPTTPTVPATPSNDARFRFVSTMKVGTNQERLNMAGMMFGTVSVRRDRGYYDYLTSIGTDHDRYFSPVNFTQDRGCGTAVPGIWACDQLLDCAQQSMIAHRRAIYSPLDVVDKAEFSRWDDIKTWFTMACKRTAERAMDPEWFAFEIANEWATNDMGLFNARSNELYAIARQHLPNHRIIVGGPEWNGIHRFDDTWQAPPDNDYIVQFHHYEQLNRAQWAGKLSKLAAFCKKLNVPPINGELNVGFDKMNQKAHAAIWAANFIEYASSGYKIPMNPWAFIGGKNDFRLNVGPTDPRAIPLMESTFKQCSQLMSV